MSYRLLVAAIAILVASASARADGCDALTARLIRATGASLAGRSGPLVVFRAADADRMSLDCGPPQRLLFRSRDRLPNRYYFVLIGLAAKTFNGARAEDVETLALQLHQTTLLTGRTQEGRTGPARLRCEPGDRLDGVSEGTLCRLASDRASRRHGRIGLPADAGFR